LESGFSSELNIERTWCSLILLEFHSHIQILVSKLRIKECTVYTRNAS
jgi:hypothetical protein